MIEVIAEHSVDTFYLKEKSKILDAGCRGFEFTYALRKMGHSVWPIDCDDTLGSIDYYHCALTDKDGFTYLLRTNDSQAIRVTKVLTEEKVITRNLDSISKEFQISFWDLIKLDIEGSEYEVIMSLEKAPAKQISIEFHLHTGIYGFYEMNLMEDKLKGLGYKAVKHELTEQHGAGKNYWDSLFILQ